MSLKARIASGGSSETEASVGPERALWTTALPFPPMIEQKVLPFRQFMTSTGLAAGSSDMRVNGTAAAPLDFFIPADDERDRYITTLSFVIADTTNFAMNEFAALGAALTNGCQLFYLHPRFGRINIHDAIKTNFDLIRLGFAEPAFGATTTTFRGTNFVGTAEAILPIVDLRRIIPPFGIKLDAGQDQSLVFRVRDDLSSGIVTFDCIAYGFDRFE